MPVRKRVDRRKSAIPPWDMEIDLDIGWLSDRTDEEMREAWERYGQYMVDRARYETPGMRPVAWWTFDRDRDPPDVRDEADTLFKMGELDELEIAAIRSLWRGNEHSAPAFLADTANG